MTTATLARSALQAHAAQLAVVRQSLRFPHKTSDASGSEEDVPHIELIDQVIASLQEARKALGLHRPNFAKADGFIEEAGRHLRALEELPCGGDE